MLAPYFKEIRPSSSSYSQYSALSNNKKKKSARKNHNNSFSTPSNTKPNVSFQTEKSLIVLKPIFKSQGDHEHSFSNIHSSQSSPIKLNNQNNSFVGAESSGPNSTIFLTNIPEKANSNTVKPGEAQWISKVFHSHPPKKIQESSIFNNILKELRKQSKMNVLNRLKTKPSKPREEKSAELKSKSKSPRLKSPNQISNRNRILNMNNVASSHLKSFTNTHDTNDQIKHNKSSPYNFSFYEQEKSASDIRVTNNQDERRYLSQRDLMRSNKQSYSPTEDSFQAHHQKHYGYRISDRTNTSVHQVSHTHYSSQNLLNCSTDDGKMHSPLKKRSKPIVHPKEDHTEKIKKEQKRYKSLIKSDIEVSFEKIKEKLETYQVN